MKRFSSVVLAIIFCLQTSFAQNKPSLIVSPLKGKNTKAAMDSIGNEFKKSNQVFVVDFTKVMEYVSSKQTKKAKKSTKAAVEAFEKGKKAYQNLNIQESIEQFEKSKILYQDALWDEDSFQGLRTTKFNLAMAYLADKKETQAKLELQEMILIDPSRKDTKPSEKYYSPKVRQLYQKVYQEIEKAEHGGLQISTTPAQAVVMMDGAVVGKTPLELRSIPAGRHYFRLSSGDQDEFLEKFIVAGNNEIEFTFSQISNNSSLDYFKTLGTQKELDQPRATYLDEMGLALGADLFVFLTPLAGQVKGQLYDQRSQELSKEVSAPNPQVLVTELLKSLGPDGYVVASEHEVPTPKAITQPQNTTPDVGVELKPRPNASPTPGLDYKDTPPPANANQQQWYQKPWVWGLIGGAVVGAGVGLYLGGVINFDSNNSTVKTTIP